MEKKYEMITFENREENIYTIHGIQVMIDRDLAELNNALAYLLFVITFRMIFYLQLLPLQGDITDRH